MNVLIDTHILLWSLANTKKLNTQEKKILVSPQTSIYVSAVSLWEISLKYSIGKLIIEPFDVKKIISGIHDSNYSMMPLTGEEASGFYQLPHTSNTDPFDRMLCWQAICNDYYFMSRDAKINQYKKFGLKLIDRHKNYF